MSRLALGFSCLLVAACGASAQSEFDHEFDDSSGGTTPTDEVEQAIEQQRVVLQHLRNDPAARELVVKTFWTIAELHSRLRDQVAYRRALQDVVRSFDASGLALGSDAADYAARAQFVLAELESESVRSFVVNPGRQPTLEAYVRALVAQINDVSRRATAATNSLDAVTRFGRASWTSAALVRRAQVYEAAAQAVLSAPFVMPDDLERQLGRVSPDARREIETQVEARIRLTLEEQAEAIQCMAIADYVLVARMARVSGADSQDARAALSRIHRLDDVRVSRCVEQRRTHDATFAAYVPGEFAGDATGSSWVAVQTSEVSARVFATEAGDTHCGYVTRGAMGRLVRVAAERALVELVDGGVATQVWFTRADLRRADPSQPDPTHARASNLASYENTALGPPLHLPASARLEHSGVVIATFRTNENIVRAVRETAEGAHVVASGPHAALSLFGLARGYTSLTVGHHARVVGEPPVHLRATAGADPRVGIIAPGAPVEILRTNGGWAEVSPLGLLRVVAWLPVENLLGVAGVPQPAAPALPAAFLADQDATLLVLRAGSTITLAGGLRATASRAAFATRASPDGAEADVLVAVNDELMLRGNVRLDALIAPSPTPSRPTAPTGTGEVSSDGSAPSAVLAALSSVVRVWCPIEPEGMASGSGTIVSTRGAVLTNFHVVGSPEHGTPYHSNRMCFVGPFRNARAAVQPEWVAQVEFGLAGSDLAVLRVTAALRGFSLPTEFPAAAIGPDVNIGARVFVAGFPSSSTIELTSGAVSGFTSDGGGEWIRTDARINPGNSGGAMFDSQGRLVGVPTAVQALHVFEAVGHARPVGGVPREWWRL